jgi:hypothetical protein
MSKSLPKIVLPTLLAQFVLGGCAADPVRLNESGGGTSNVVTSSAGGQTSEGGSGTALDYPGGESANTGGSSLLAGGAGLATGGTISVVGGMTSSSGGMTSEDTSQSAGGTASGGVSSSVGGGATVQCSLLTEADCTLNLKNQGGCMPAYGSTKLDFSTSVYAGCRTGTFCVSAETCAYPASHPESCLRFADGCFPNDWIGDMSCATTGCPPT